MKKTAQVVVRVRRYGHAVSYPASAPTEVESTSNNPAMVMQDTLGASKNAAVGAFSLDLGWFAIGLLVMWSLKGSGRGFWGPSALLQLLEPVIATAGAQNGNSKL